MEQMPDLNPYFGCIIQMEDRLDDARVRWLGWKNREALIRSRFDNRVASIFLISGDQLFPGILVGLDEELSKLQVTE